MFDRNEGSRSAESVDCGHGRVETLRCDVTGCLRFSDGKGDWKGLRSILRVCSERYNKKTEESSVEQRYCITSLPDDPAFLNAAIRSHWAIENNLHWNLDVIFGEDRQLKMEGNSAQNFNLISKIAMAMIDAEKSTKDSKPNKRIRAACSDRFRELVSNV